MCGIIGYTGGSDCLPVVMRGLERLLYRGYDSAGAGFFIDGEIICIKAKGRLDALNEKLIKGEFFSHTGIGHTRWATHGEPDELNSHPQISNSGKIAVVHNGIIENYVQLRKFLSDRGFVFSSATDTEVIPNLIEYFCEDDILAAFKKVLDMLTGSYALGVIVKGREDCIFAARKGSPLIIGFGNEESYIASDISAIVPDAAEVIYLEDGEYAMVKKAGVDIFNSSGIAVQRERKIPAFESSHTGRGDFEHYMLKEIHETPAVLGRLMEDSVEIFDKLAFLDAGFLGNIGRIHITACGSAFHAGIVAGYIIEDILGIPVNVEVASEFRYRNPVIKENDLVIVISQSGETADTLHALRQSKKQGAKILAIVNTKGSSVDREADFVLYTKAGAEIAVASTKAYTAQLFILYLVISDFAVKLKIRGAEFDMTHIPGYLYRMLDKKNSIKSFVERFVSAPCVFYIGRGLDYALSEEGSLKLKEVSYIFSEAYAGGELKHGTIAMIERNTLVIACITQKGLKEKMISNILEVKARGAYVLVITSGMPDDEIINAADEVVSIPDIPDVLAPLVLTVPMQLIAYYFALLRGCDVDKPRNLAKSVTVE